MHDLETIKAMNASPASDLFDTFTRACISIARGVAPGYVIAADAPETYEGIKEAFAARGHLTVWSGASDNTIYTKPEGNYAFRAWHDYRHITEDADFSTGGECQTYRAQCDDLRAWVSCNPGAGFRYTELQAILRAEVIGQLAYKITHGDFPTNQKAFVKAFLINEGDAIDARI